MDVSSVAYQTKYTLGDMTGPDDLPTGILFGMLSRILSLGFRYKTNQFVFCFDSPSGQGHRKAIYPEYKSNRTPMEAEEKRARRQMYREINVLRNFTLPCIGFKNLQYEMGFEADDLIASQIITTPGFKFVMCTSDHDMFQLLESGRVVMTRAPAIRNPRGRPDSPGDITEESFTREKGISPRKWAMVKAIAGCASDTVEGIIGVGEGTAIKYINDDLPPHYKSFLAITSPMGQDTIKRNQKLVTLPYYGCPADELHPDEFSKKGFWTVCRKYGLATFRESTMKAKWACFFRGDFSEGDDVVDPPAGRIRRRTK